MSSADSTANLTMLVSAYRAQAKALLSPEIFDYIDGAAGDEVTRRDNQSSYDSIKLRPFCLRDVSKTELQVELLGRTLAAPIMIGPTAFHALVNDAGEPATARGAKACGVPMIVSSMSSFSMEEIAQQSGHENLWFQCYLLKNRAITADLVARAEAAGYRALVLTVGAPVHGKRYRDAANRFRLPEDCRRGNFESRAGQQSLHDFANNLLDPSVTWADVQWLQSITRLPLILKGVLNPQDAERACAEGVAGIVVSNHGGRQLDTAEAGLFVLPDVVAAVGGAIPVLIDGGIGKGPDIVKALALGADAVLLGRPAIWALAVAGERGVCSMLQTLAEDFEAAMQLCGCRSPAQLRRDARALCSLPPGLSLGG